MGRARMLQVTLDGETQFALESLASQEGRSLSNMSARLIYEALRARGVELPEPAAPRRYHGGRG